MRWKKSEFNGLVSMKRMRFGDYGRILSLCAQGSIQTAVFDDERWPDLVFAYYRAIVHELEKCRDLTHPQTKLLFIGGGACAIPMYCAVKYPQLEISVVDIDPVMFELAEKYCGLKHARSLCTGLQTVVMDGRRYLELLDDEVLYDAIVIDAFDEGYVVEDLVSIQTLSLLQKHLKSEGLLLINSVADEQCEIINYEPIFSIASRVEELFSRSKVFPVEEFGISDETKKAPKKNEPICVNYLIAANMDKKTADSSDAKLLDAQGSSGMDTEIRVDTKTV